MKSYLMRSDLLLMAAQCSRVTFSLSGCLTSWPASTSSLHRSNAPNLRNNKRSNGAYQLISTPNTVCTGPLVCEIFVVANTVVQQIAAPAFHPIFHIPFHPWFASRCLNVWHDNTPVFVVIRVPFYHIKLSPHFCYKREHFMDEVSKHILLRILEKSYCSPWCHCSTSFFSLLVDDGLHDVPILRLCRLC